MRSQRRPTVRRDNANLRATNTDKALWAWTPNTFLKNKAATVTPEDSISFVVAALMNALELVLSKAWRVARAVRKISNVSEDIQNSAYAEP
jgi:hypothetical protein